MPSYKLLKQIPFKSQVSHVLLEELFSVFKLSMSLHVVRSTFIAYWSLSVAMCLENCFLYVGFYFSVCGLSLYSTHVSSSQNGEEIMPVNVLTV